MTIACCSCRQPVHQPARYFIKYVITLAILAAPCLGLAQANYDTVKIRPVKVTDQIYYLKGSGGHIGVLTGKDGVVMIDDQFAPLSEKIQAAIAALDPSGVRFLINTHIHGDHTGGNENLKRSIAGLTIVAHDQVRNRMMTEQFNARQNRTVPPRDKDAWPLITFKDRIVLHLNDEDIELFYTAPGHTDGDVIVFFRKANVFHLGDAFRNGYPFIDTGSGGTFAGYIATLDNAISLMNDQSRVMSGHTEVCGRADVQRVRDRLVDIRDQVAGALKKGTKKEDVGGLPIAAKYDAEWWGGFVKGKDFVLLVAEELSKK
jgi:glyoxylase-like metal-dependent hydrolase (beta-lactamase superfamily II)